MPRLIRLTIGAGRFLIPVCRRIGCNVMCSTGFSVSGRCSLPAWGESDLMLRRVNGWDPDVQSA